MDSLSQILESAGWPRNLMEIGRERLLALWRFAIQPPGRFRAEVFGELLRSVAVGEWEEKDWMEVAQAMRGSSEEERRSLVEVMGRRLGILQPLLTRILTALYAASGNGNTGSDSRGEALAAAAATEGSPGKKRKIADRKGEENAAAADGPQNALIEQATISAAVDGVGFSEHLTRLALFSIDERALDSLILAISEGGFRCLEELIVYVSFNDGKKDSYKCVNIVKEGALPCLKEFATSACVFTSKDRFWAEHLPRALQSFVLAAPNLEIVETACFLDLTGRKVKTLSVPSDEWLFQEGEVVRMINSTKETLLTLKLGECKSQVPFLPNLLTLEQCDSQDRFDPIDLKAVPGIRKLVLPFRYVAWNNNDLSNLFPPKGNLKEISLDWIAPMDGNNFHPLIDSFNLLLNAELDQLSLKFDGITTTQLRNALKWVTLEGGKEVAESGRKSSVLKFHHEPETWHNDYDWKKFKSTYNLEEFSFILEKLGGNWGRVGFVGFKFGKAPSWTEAELSLFGGRKKGVVRLDKDEDIVFLEMKE